MRITRALRPLIGAVSLAALVGCAASEEEVRARLGTWLSLGETRYYDAGIECTVGVFSLRSERLSETLPVARSIAEAVGLYQLGRPFALRIAGTSVSAMSEALREADFTLGTRFVNAGLGARTCLPEPFQPAFLQALVRPGEAAIFDPETDSLTVIDSGLGRAWHTRGASM